VPGWGFQLEPARVLSDLRELGLAATELGPPGFLPDDPARLRSLLEEHGLRLVAAFVAVVLHDPATAEADLRKALEELVSLGLIVDTAALETENASAASSRTKARMERDGRRSERHRGVDMELLLFQTAALRERRESTHGEEELPGEGLSRS